MINRNIKDIFIDFDDTIYDTHGNACIALGELFEDMKFSRWFNTLEDFTIPYWEANRRLWGQYSRGEIQREYLMIERFREPLSKGHNCNPTKEFCLEVSNHFLDLCAVKPGILPGAREILEYLKPKYRLHLCSNGFHEVQYRKLEASDTLKYFDNIILSEDAGVNKPNPEFFEYAIRITDASKESTVMIGDNYNTDIIGAKSAGIPQIYFNRWNTDDNHEGLSKIENLEELRGLL